MQTESRDRLTHAEIAIRDRIADIMTELHAATTREDVRAIVKLLSSLESYAATAHASASDKEDRILAAS